MKNKTCYIYLLSKIFRIFAYDNPRVSIMIILDTYKAGGHKLNDALLWEYDMSTFNWQTSKKLVVQRVVELGDLEDFYAAFDLYGGIGGFREILKSVPYLNDLDMNFVCNIFNLKKEELKCYKKKLSNQEHWNS